MVEVTCIWVLPSWHMDRMGLDLARRKMFRRPWGLEGWWRGVIPLIRMDGVMMEMEKCIMAIPMATTMEKLGTSKRKEKKKKKEKGEKRKGGTERVILILTLIIIINIPVLATKKAWRTHKLLPILVWAWFRNWMFHTMKVILLIVTGQ